jgi:hypothetical protein
MQITLPLTSICKIRDMKFGDSDNVNIINEVIN